MRVLLDTGVFSHSEFTEGAVQSQIIKLGDTTQSIDVHGFVRRLPHRDAQFQKQKEALFTVGRLIRERRIEAFVYDEIQFERARAGRGWDACNALKSCEIGHCKPALHRSRFRTTIDFACYLSKGGKKDRKAGAPPNEATQIAFLEWLCSLSQDQIDGLLPDAAILNMTPFEVESWKDLKTFQFLCLRSGSPENYPDVFHFWTAQRNGLAAILTLDKGLPNLIARVKAEKVKRVNIQTEALSPLDLLSTMGIGKPDPVPIEENRFYYFHELL